MMDWSTLSHLPETRRRALQDRLIRRYVRHQLPYSPYYRRVFADRGLSFTDIRTTDDLVHVPFVTKEDIAPTREDPSKPRQFILQPNEDLIRRHASVGTRLKLLGMQLARRDPTPALEWEYKPLHIHFTTGRSALPTPFTYTAHDLELLRKSGARMLNVIGIDREQVAVNAFPYSPHLAFWLAFFALRQTRITSVHTGGGKIMGSSRILDAVERLRASLIIAIPGYFYHMLRQAEQEGRDLRHVQYVVFGGDRVSPGLTEKARDMLTHLGAKNPQFFATYAMTEGKTAWIQCAEGMGYHTYPDLEFWEVVDEKGRRVPDGEPGELVYTSLAWRGTAVIRYRTGDMTPGMSRDPCPACGKTVPRIHPDIQRRSDVRELQLTKVKGELVNLNAFYPILSGMRQIEEWQVQIRKKDDDPFEVDEIVVVVAIRAGVTLASVEKELTKRIGDEAGVTPRVEERSMATLLQDMGMETELKEKRIIDMRPGARVGRPPT